MTTDPRRLSNTAARLIQEADRIGVCSISCWEIGMLVGANRIELDRDVRQWVRQALAADRVEPIPLTAEIALDAAMLPDSFPGDPADRIIYATAAALGAGLVTRDARLTSYDPQRTVW